eukprot:390164-Amphidinium_carterae.1
MLNGTKGSNSRVSMICTSSDGLGLQSKPQGWAKNVPVAATQSLRRIANTKNGEVLAGSVPALSRLSVPEDVIPVFLLVVSVVVVLVNVDWSWRNIWMCFFHRRFCFLFLLLACNIMIIHCSINNSPSVTNCPSRDIESKACEQALHFTDEIPPTAPTKVL